jgi:hypothetical protein
MEQMVRRYSMYFHSCTLVFVVYLRTVFLVPIQNYRFEALSYSKQYLKFQFIPYREHNAFLLQRTTR